MHQMPLQFYLHQFNKNAKACNLHSKVNFKLPQITGSRINWREQDVSKDKGTLNQNVCFLLLSSIMLYFKILHGHNVKTRYRTHTHTCTHTYTHTEFWK